MAPMGALVVDPDVAARRRVVEALSPIFEEPVDEATDASSGQASFRPAYHRLVLVELDLGQPAEGPALVEWLRARSTVPVVFLGRAADRAALHRLGAAGADGYLVKPFAEAAILSCARTLLSVAGADRVAGPGPVERPVLSPVQLERIEAYVERALGQTVSLASMAEQVEMSRGHFSRLFKETTGSTPYGFVTERRLARAKALLVQSSLSIGDVAAEVGYENQGHFSTSFKRATGLTPRAFRRSRGA
jgi:AraC-like DNA-binding protein